MNADATQPPTTADVHHDLLVIGTGSGNSVVDGALADWDVGIVERASFGGTCLNHGCIPTKMYAYPADVALAAGHGPELGLRTNTAGADWPTVRDRIFARIDPLSDGGRSHRSRSGSGVRVYEGSARFVGERLVDTGTGAVVSADHVVLATGSRPVVPPIPGLEEVEHHTSDTVMRLAALPRRLLVLGGGYVAAEFAHVFSAFGSQVTVVSRSERLLPAEDHEVATRFTELVQERWAAHLGRVVERFERRPSGEGRAHLDDGGTVDFDVVLLGVGRVPNTEDLGLDAAGVTVGDGGLVDVDAHQRTSAANVWALGDVSSPHQLKHVANADARVVRHNLLHPEDLWAVDNSAVPHAVFTAPQVASVGISEQEAQRRAGSSGLRYVVARQRYSDTAYGWAMEDTTSFCKLLADPASGVLLGAHLVGPQASILIQPLVGAMAQRVPVDEVARSQYWIHPALMEVVENALLAVELDQPRA